MTPYCKHMGSDLSVGDVIGNDLRCAFHHWQYGPTGQCTAIPSGDRIPQAACVRTFHVEEKWDMVWVFWGNEPVYPVPSFEDWDDERWVYRSFEVPLDDKVQADPWMFSTNLFDFVHFRVVHEIPGLDPDVEWGQWGAEWTAFLPHPTVGEMTMNLRLLGTNSVISRSGRDEEILTHIAAATPMGEQGTRFFVCVATQRSDKAALALDQQQALHTELINEDVPIMNTLRLGDDHLVTSDRQLAKYLRYVRDFPKMTFKELDASR
jgi:hypothetical protein